MSVARPMEKGAKRPRDEDIEVKPLEIPIERPDYSQGPHHDDLALHPTLKAPRIDNSVSFLYVSFGTCKPKNALNLVYCLMNISLVTIFLYEVYILILSLRF